jgi:hypothetical protein
VERAAGYLFGWDDDPDAYNQLGVDLIIGGLRSGTGAPQPAERQTASPTPAEVRRHISANPLPAMGIAD